VITCIFFDENDIEKRMIDFPPVQNPSDLHFRDNRSMLDVGGAPVPEAAGIEAVLTGLRAAAADDDKLLNDAGRIFDGLYNTFSQENDND